MFSLFSKVAPCQLLTQLYKCYSFQLISIAQYISTLFDILKCLKFGLQAYKAICKWPNKFNDLIKIEALKDRRFEEF